MTPARSCRALQGLSRRENSGKHGAQQYPLSIPSRYPIDAPNPQHGFLFSRPLASLFVFVRYFLFNPCETPASTALEYGGTQHNNVKVVTPALDIVLKSTFTVLRSFASAPIFKINCKANISKAFQINRRYMNACFKHRKTSVPRYLCQFQQLCS